MASNAKNLAELLNNESTIAVADVADGSITTAKLAADAVTAAKLADDSVVTANIVDGNVTAVKTTGVGKPRNLIFNGAMAISQRTTSESSVNSDRYSACDRFKIFNNQAHFTVSQETLTASDTPFQNGFTKALKLDCTTAQASPGATDRMKIRQAFEGQQMQHLKYGTGSAETLTLQFWVKATKTGANTINMYQDDANKMISASYTISASNTWEKKTVSFVGNTANVITNDNTRGILVEWNLGAGSNRTAGTLRTAWTAYAVGDELGSSGQVNHADNTANNFHITGIQLEVGSIAGDFEHLSFGEELALCYRYYQKSYNYGSAPGSSINTPYQAKIQGQGYHFFTPTYPVRMRAQPTLTTYSNGSSGASAKMYNSSTSSDINSSATSYEYGHLVHNASSVSAGHNVGYHYTADAEL